MSEEANIDEIVHRHAKAIVTMDIAQIMNDLMPDAMMKLQAAAGGGTAVQISGYDVLGHSQEGDDYLYDVRYMGPTNFTVRARWGKVGGEWRIVDADVIASEPAQ